MRSVPSWCDLGVRSRRSRRHDLGSGFVSEVEGCDLGAIQSRSRMAKLKGAKSKGSKLWVRWRSRRVRSGCNSKSKSKGSGLWVRGVIWVRSLSLFARESGNGLKWKFLLQTISGSNQLKHTVNWKVFPENLFFMRNQTPTFTEKHFQKWFEVKTNTT